ncbi:hypothetical protein HanRHA438_Chr15g0700841 [Helianthus annuus]|nr:hypothetical protein HanIR_Chr15g0748141 [Helianthus annuus]KAJ0844294.1 hypothetical protein HanRHA438_Chr15g0700841 [Helianthus annuus]
MLHHTCKSQHRITRSHQIPNILLKIQINNIIPIIRHIRFPILPNNPKFSYTTCMFKQASKLFSSKPPTKRHNLNGQSQSTAPNIINQLGCINNYNKLFTTTFYHLLAEQRSTSAFNQIHMRVDFIRSVDC